MEGILFYDVVSAKAAGDPRERSLASMRLAVDRAIVSISTKVVLSIGDGQLIVINDFKDTLALLRGVAGSWARPPDDSVSPFLLGVKAGLVAGTVGYDGKTISGYAIKDVANLCKNASVGTILMSNYAWDELKVRLDAVQQTNYMRYLRAPLQPGFHIGFYEVDFNAFLGRHQFSVQVANPADLARHLATHPERLYQIAPRDFERVIAEIMDGFGYEVELTQQTRDRGIDIIAMKREASTGIIERYLVECKRHSPENRVGISVVHRLIGAGLEEPHTGLIIATTSYFTGPALEVANHANVRWRLHLKDYDAIRHWLLDYARGAQRLCPEKD